MVDMKIIETIVDIPEDKEYIENELYNIFIKYCT